MDILISCVIGVMVGIFVGRRVAERSEHEEKIVGGKLARFCHQLSCIAFTGGLPAGLGGLLLGTGFRDAVFLALGFLGVSFLSLLLHAFIEYPAKQKAKLEDDEGWTEQKARTSGL
jgi:hypothetical protein